MLSIKNDKTDWLLDLFSMAVLFSLFYAIWIGSYALFTPDEARYSEVAREMVATGDYITPRLNGVAFLDKPILYYWLQASAIKLFGIKEWALRFWPAFLGVLGTIVTYIAGRLLFNRRTGILSAIILATCPLYFGGAHYANLDLEVAVLICSALLCFMVGIKASSSHQRNLFLLAAYIFTGLAALTKGLIGIVFPAMIIGLWIILLNRWSILKRMHLGLGLLIFALISLPWYFLAQQANPEFFQFFFVKQQISRFLTTEQFNNQTVAWFYLPIVTSGLIPWCVFSLQALAQHLKNSWKNRQQHDVELFLLIWFFFIFIFFSIPKSKTIGYILPVFPALALLIGNYLSQCWDRATKTKGIILGIIFYQALCIGVVTTCILIAFYHVSELKSQMIPYLLCIGGLFTLSGVLVLVLAKNIRVPQIFSIFTVTATLFLLIIVASGDAINQKTLKPLVMQIKSQIRPLDEVVTFKRYYHEIPIYLERRITIVNDWHAADIPLNDNWVREIWYGMSFQDTKEWLINEDTFWDRWYSSKHLIVFTDPDFVKVIQQKSKTAVYKLGEYNDTIILSNQPR